MSRCLLFGVPISDIWAVPPVAGVYVLIDVNRVYCGHSSSLERRFPETLRKRKFGLYFYFLSEDIMVFSDESTTMACLKELEDDVISALNTIIYGNGLPIYLANQESVSLLPGIAWTKNCPKEYRLAIHIAQTALFGMGIPMPLTFLPSEEAIFTDLSIKLLDWNTAEWNNILSAEFERRESGTAMSPPMFTLHPA